MLTMSVSLWSSVTPNILECVFMGGIVLSICRCGFGIILCRVWCEYWEAIWSDLSMSLLFFVHVCICCRYSCMYAFAGV